MDPIFAFLRWPEEAIRRHGPLGTGILINSGKGVRRRVYTTGVRKTQIGNPGLLDDAARGKAT